jgi:hypothetical protein
MAAWQFHLENGRVLSTSGIDADCPRSECYYDVYQKQWRRRAQDVRFVTLIWKTRPAVSLIHVRPCLRILTDKLDEK